MRIAYVSTDEVNQNLAERMAAKCGAVICIRPSREPAPDGLFDAVLYNLDDVPRDERSAVLEGLGRDKPAHPTAVHGYDITDEQARILKRYGVAATRRLHAGLLLRLSNAARQSRETETVPPDNDGTDLTWVNLVN